LLECGTPASGGALQRNPSSPMISPHRPARMITYPAIVSAQNSSYQKYRYCEHQCTVRGRKKV